MPLVHQHCLEVHRFADDIFVYDASALVQLVCSVSTLSSGVIQSLEDILKMTYMYISTPSYISNRLVETASVPLRQYLCSMTGCSFIQTLVRQHMTFGGQSFGVAFFSPQTFKTTLKIKILQQPRSYLGIRPFVFNIHIKWMKFSWIRSQGIRTLGALYPQAY